MMEPGQSAPDRPAILVVDDDPDLRMLVAFALGRAGMEGVQASSGEEALAILEDRAVQAVVVDMGMAGMSGLDVIRTLRGDPDTATLPVLMMTGSGGNDTVLEALRAGADDFLAKPIRLDELVARVRAHLRTNTAWTLVASDLSARADLVGLLGGLALSSEPTDAAAALVSELGRRAGYAFVAVMQLTDDGLVEVLATYNEDAGVERGGRIPVDRARYIVSRVRDGPWVEVVETRRDDEPLNAFWAANLELSAGAPIFAGNRVVGVLIIGDGRRADTARSVTTARLLAEAIDYANILSVSAGSAIARHGTLAGTRARIADIISERRFEAVFQPIVDLGDDRVIAYEALTRFADDIPADVHFAEALEHGLGLELEVAAIEVALAATRDLPTAVPISLNASPTLVLDREVISRLLDETDRSAILEITEHARIDDYVVIREAVRSYGGRIWLAVDDAGAGYASLRHILELRPAFVKLDISIVRGIEKDPVRQALVSGLVYFALKTGCELIAEGIETTAELDVLTEVGVALGQGYLLGQPLPPTITRR